MQYLLYILVIPFLYFNFKIVFSDLKNKIIPNKYLGYLLLLIPFYYIYIFFSFPDINYLLFILQIIITFIISFILYYFWIWAAWDAKYLLVLALFIPYIWIIPFIWNIALLTIIYLLGYFLWFYFWKCIFYRWYAKSLLLNIKKDLNEKWNIYKLNKWWKTIFIILKWLLIFLIIFVSIRLSRIYLFNTFFNNWENYEILNNILEKYNFYLIFWFIWTFILILYLFKFLINKFKKYISSKLWINNTFITNFFIIILLIILLSFIGYEYSINKNEIINNLYRIFTFYIIFYLIIKIIFYSYKISFGLAEHEFINIKYLKEWNIIDKEYLKKTLNIVNPKNNKTIENFNKNLNYINNIWNTLDNQDVKKIIYIYDKTNKLCKSDEIINKWFNKLENIKVLKTFAFWLYIFVWFIITYFLNSFLIKILSNNITENIVKIFNYWN